jgi:glycosyltransferase involved in cell wall biosynthesis
MATDSVSVVIPVWNGARYLGAAIESVLAQTTSPLELIVVDDGSTDASVEVAAEYAAVRVVSQAHAGPGAARNCGVELAGGAYVAFLDADDLWVETKLERQLAAFAAQPSADVVVGCVRHFAGHRPPDDDGDGDPGELRPGYLPSAVLLSRSAWQAVGPFRTDLRVAELMDWLLRARELGRGELVVPDHVVWRRVHGENLTIVERASLGEYAHILKEALDRRREGTR